MTANSMLISPLAGKPAPTDLLVNVSELVNAYYREVPDATVAGQRVAFGTSGHRGSSLSLSFNEAHVLAISQAICLFRQQHGITGPLFIGIDTHALSGPAYMSALEVLAANGVELMIAPAGDFTPTPAISHAIVCYNRGRNRGLADGIVITPSHNPPQYGGFKYNPPHGGPAQTDITDWIEQQANILLEHNLRGVQRIALEKALALASTHSHDFMSNYVNDLHNIIDMDAIRAADVRMGVDPLGGAGVHYWPAIAQRYGLNLNVTNTAVDVTFKFMTVDWDGQIRMDPASLYAMQPLINLQQRFDIAFACDTDHDRHGIVTPNDGLMLPDHYLAVAIGYLLQHRPAWPAAVAIGKTLVSSRLINRVCAKQGRNVVEVPVGFKWFAAGLLNGTLGFAGEESAGATFLRRNGSVWTTDKDGIVPALLAAEIIAQHGRDPAQLYHELTDKLGVPFADKLQAVATPAQQRTLANLSVQQINLTTLAGEKIRSILTHAPGNDALIGGIKVETQHGWFAARPSGTEAIYKIYAESFQSDAHLQRILEEAQTMVDNVLSHAGR